MFTSKPSTPINISAYKLLLKRLVFSKIKSKPFLEFIKCLQFAFDCVKSLTFEK